MQNDARPAIRTDRTALEERMGKLEEAHTDARGRIDRLEEAHTDTQRMLFGWPGPNGWNKGMFHTLSDAVEKLAADVAQMRQDSVNFFAGLKSFGRVAARVGWTLLTVVGASVVAFATFVAHHVSTIAHMLDKVAATP